MANDQMGYHLHLFLLISFCFMLSCHAFQFKVGNQRGWTVNPSEKYNDWAGRLRFQVNDTLLFKYSKGVDSVLVVNKNDYDNCNTDKPILKFDDGNTVFKFDRSGPFYFITANKDNCQKGQKMIVVVLAIRNRSPPSSTPTPSPPGQHSPSPSPIPSSPPAGQQSPSPSPSPASSTPSPSPASQAPVPSPSGGGSGSTPTSAPAPAPTPTTTMPPSSSPSPSSGLSPPPSITPAGSPGLSPPGGGGGGGGGVGPGPSSDSTPSDARSPTSPPGGSSATPVFTASVVLFSTVSLVLYGGLAIFI